MDVTFVFMLLSQELRNGGYFVHCIIGIIYNGGTQKKTENLLPPVIFHENVCDLFRLKRTSADIASRSNGAVFAVVCACIGKEGFEEDGITALGQGNGIEPFTFRAASSAVIFSCSARTGKVELRIFGEHFEFINGLHVVTDYITGQKDDINALQKLLIIYKNCPFWAVDICLKASIMKLENAFFHRGCIFSKGERIMNDKVKRVNNLLLAVFLVSALVSCATMGTAKTESESQGIVDKARVTFNDFMSDQQFSWFHEHLKDARGLLIYPQVIKGGFVAGGEGGTGVLVVRDSKTGSWSQPAFYTVGGVTFGLQIGGEAAEVIVMAMSQKAVDSLLTTSVKFGGDTSVALGPIGMGAKANITADFISFAKTKGLYAGINLEGAVVDVRDSLNRAYYGRDVTPVDILIKKDVKNEGSAALIRALSRT